MARYFTSDWHLNERRLGEFNPFFRPFANVEEQNRTILDRINAAVGPEDELFVLGDVAVDDAGVALLDRLRCKRRTLIVGNYDEPRLASLGRHFDTVADDLRIDVGGISCYLNHYPTKHVADAFNITGHIHGLWKVKPKMVNVGVDAWHFRPVSEKEILFVENAIRKYYDDNVFVCCR